jgi:hypothetical protein
VDLVERQDEIERIKAGAVPVGGPTPEDMTWLLGEV